MRALEHQTRSSFYASSVALKALVESINYVLGSERLVSEPQQNNALYAFTCSFYITDNIEPRLAYELISQTPCWVCQGQH